MSEWWTYSLSDFLMFTARTYWRLLERYNRDVWPGHLLAIAVGMAVIGCLVRSRGEKRRSAYLLLGAGWAWVAWAYHLMRYADINTAAPYFAAGFALQASLLWIAALRRQPGSASAAGWQVSAGIGIACAGVFAYPLLSLAGGHGWRRAEVVGIAPDPTVVVTLGVLLATRAHPVLWLLPILWCAVSGATLVQLQAH